MWNQGYPVIEIGRVTGPSTQFIYKSLKQLGYRESTQMITRSQIVEAARSFVGLPYHPQFPSRGLLLAVADRLGLPKDMGALQGKFKSEHGLIPGDVVVVRIGASTAWRAIVTRHPEW